MPDPDKLSDTELLAAFNDTAIPLENWTHQTHLRIAYVHLKSDPFDTALEKIRNGIQRYNSAKSIEEALESGYHETMTQAWMRLVDFTMQQYGTKQDSVSFLEAQPQLTQKSLLRFFYSHESFVTTDAKANFVEPDLTPFPRSSKAMEVPDSPLDRSLKTDT